MLTLTDDQVLEYAKEGFKRKKTHRCNDTNAMKYVVSLHHIGQRENREAILNGIKKLTALTRNGKRQPGLISV